MEVVQRIDTSLHRMWNDQGRNRNYLTARELFRQHSPHRNEEKDDTASAWGHLLTLHEVSASTKGQRPIQFCRIIQSVLGHDQNKLATCNLGPNCDASRNAIYINCAVHTATVAQVNLNVQQSLDPLFPDISFPRKPPTPLYSGAWITDHCSLN